MAAALVQASKNGFVGSQATLVVTLSSGVTAGNIVVVAGMFQSSVASVTMSDAAADAVTDSGLGLFSDANTATKSFFKAFFTPTAGQTTFTATYATNPGYGDLYVWEISGLTSATFDKVVKAAGTSAAANGANSGTTGVLTSATEFGMDYTTTDGAMSATPGTGWSTGQGSTVGTNLGDGVESHTSSIGEHRVIAATTAISGLATMASGGNWVAWCATVMAGSTDTLLGQACL